MSSVRVELAYGLFKIDIILPKRFVSKEDFNPEKYLFGITAHLTESGILLMRRKKMAFIHENDVSFYHISIFLKDSVDSQMDVSENDYSLLSISLGGLYNVLRLNDPYRTYFELSVIRREIVCDATKFDMKPSY